MKLEDYTLIETTLQNCYDDLQECYELCDTSLKDKTFETDNFVNEWNKRWNELRNEIQCLKEEMIYTFKITKN